ncbi:NAD(P)H-dependent flavin oxidoreductase [Rummeliibacillus pycnus]|uniref:NAD(P)H-dependent flavin oxidoreductase n=1 Tax=Rummeliibacillus pycnus TaxID=101070 RepID=UPI0037CB4233
MRDLCKLLKIKYPIIQGGMGNISSPILASAVSNAGGLGTIGCGTMTPFEVEKLIIDMKKRTTMPFSINIPINVNEYSEELLKLVIKHEVPIVSLSAGNPAPFILKLHEAGIKVIVVVAAVKHALKAEAAGADVLVAEGFEAAGINSHLELTTLTLIPQITNAVKVPVVAAGGIANGNGVAAALALGASGVQMGTRFIATQEMTVHDAYKKRIIDATDQETMILGRSVGQVRRVLRNPYAEKISLAEKNGISLEEYNNHTSEVFHVKGAIEGNSDQGFMNSGQIAGLINDLPTVQELLESIMEECLNCIKRLSEYSVENV